MTKINVDEGHDIGTGVAHVDRNGKFRVWRGQPVSLDEIRKQVQEAQAEVGPFDLPVSPWPYPMPMFTRDPIKDDSEQVAKMAQIVGEMRDLANSIPVTMLSAKSAQSLKDMDFDALEKQVETIRYSKAITERADKVWLWQQGEAKHDKVVPCHSLRDYQQHAVKAIRNMGAYVTVAIEQRHATEQKRIAAALEEHGYTVVPLNEIGTGSPSLDLSGLERRAWTSVKCPVFPSLPNKGFKTVKSASARKRKRVRDGHRQVIVFPFSGVETGRWSASSPQRGSIPKSEIWGTSTGRMTSDESHVSQKPRATDVRFIKNGMSPTGRINREGPATYSFGKNGIVRTPRD